VDIASFFKFVNQRVLSSPRKPAATIAIPRERVDEFQGKPREEPFKRDTHYFQVVINEMFLSKARKWFWEIDPVVYVVSEFSYNGKAQVVPFLVGPNLLKEQGVPDSVASGTILRNTVVSGLHPYRGGGLTLTVVLCEVSGENVLKPFLGILETTAKALDFSPALAPYAKVASLVMDGVETLFKSNGVTPIAGLREPYGPTHNTLFQPSYFAILDAQGVAEDKLWVRKKQLCHGDSLDTAKPYRGADFVLYSFAGTQDNERDDIDTLPFRDLWERVRHDALSPKDEPDFASARQLMSTLCQQVMTSPDLTDAQGGKLADEWFAKMNELHEKAKRYGPMSGEDAVAETEQLVRARERALKMLKG